MAIVKFVSAHNCQVFIDMELAGKVTSDSMLKVTLGTGGYFIQIKDEDGNLIKKYEIKIKSSDNQLLQKIDEANNELNDVIENLKNDPSLVFHCDRAAFCYNGLYGFIDKTFTVVIPPIYYHVNTFEDDKAFVVRDFPEGRKTTMIDRDGNMFFNRWFDYIGEGDSNILLGIDDRIIVYSKRTYSKVNEFILDEYYDFVYPLVPVSSYINEEKFCGYIDLDGNIAIPFIFDKVGNFWTETWEDRKGKRRVNKRAKVLYLGKEIEISSDGYYYEKENGSGIYMLKSWQSIDDGTILKFDEDRSYHPFGPTRWTFIPIWHKDKWEVKIIIKVYPHSKNPNGEIKEKIIECNRISILESGYFVCKCKTGIKVVSANIYTNGLDEFNFDADEVKPIIRIDKCVGSGDDTIFIDYFVLQKDSHYGLANQYGDVTIPIKYDNIESINSKYAKISLKGKLAVANSMEFLTPFDYDRVSILNENAILLEKNNKCGLLIYGQTIPAIYDRINNCGGSNIVSIDGRYGIIDNTGKEILSIRYDEIVPLDNSYFKVKINNGWSLGYLTNGNICSGTYDDITLFSKNEHDVTFIESFLVNVGSRYGCINGKGDILVPIEFDRIELDSTFYNPRNFSFILYKDSKVGFCDVSYFNSDYIACKRTNSDNFEYLNIVWPIYDECKLLRNEKSVLNYYYMHYAAVKKEGKWGILDQMPRRLTYKAIDANIEDDDRPNFTDLVFKYNSLEELEKDADNEFQRRYDKYYQPWDLYKDKAGHYWVIEEGAIIEEPSYTFPNS